MTICDIETVKTLFKVTCSAMLVLLKGLSVTETVKTLFKLTNSSMLVTLKALSVT